MRQEARLAVSVLYSFWDLLGQELLAVLQDSFQTQQSPACRLPWPLGHHPAVYGQGRTMLFGQLPPHHPSQQRFQAAGQGVGNQIWACPPACDRPTQTAFVPGRWIGDNVLCHLRR